LTHRKSTEPIPLKPSDADAPPIEQPGQAASLSRLRHFPATMDRAFAAVETRHGPISRRRSAWQIGAAQIDLPAALPLILSTSSP